MVLKESKKYTYDTFRLALTGLRNNSIGKRPDNHAIQINANQVWKELITGELLKSAAKLTKTNNWEIPAQTDFAYAHSRLDQLIQKWTIDFNGNLLKQCFSILKFQNRLLCPESCWRILTAFANKPRYWVLLTEILGPEADFLAKKNSDWSWWIDVKTDRSWKSDDQKLRLYYFSFLRQKDPHNALKLITKSWTAESLSFKKRVLYWMQFELNKKDIPFLLRTMNEKSKEIRNSSLLFLARLEAPSIKQQLHVRFHSFMEGSVKYSGQKIRFKPGSQSAGEIEHIPAGLPIFNDCFHDDSLRWLILVHPNQFARYIQTENHFRQLLTDSELYDLINVILLSTAFHRDKKWAERICKYGLLENKVSDNLPWDRIIHLVTEKLVNQIVARYLKEKIIDAFEGMIVIARNSGSVWSLKNSQDAVDKLLDELRSLSRIPNKILEGLAAIGLRLDPRVFTHYNESINRRYLNDPLAKEFQELGKILHDRSQMIKILLTT